MIVGEGTYNYLGKLRIRPSFSAGLDCGTHTLTRSVWYSATYITDYLSGTSIDNIIYGTSHAQALYTKHGLGKHLHMYIWA